MLDRNFAFQGRVALTLIQYLPAIVDIRHLSNSRTAFTAIYADTEVTRTMTPTTPQVEILW